MKFPISLDDTEKNFHAIWIGKLPVHELDNLKIWAKWNPDFKVNIWIDSNHILVPLLKQLIIANTKDNINGEGKDNPLSVALLQSKFYKEYNDQQSKISFHEFAKLFIIKQGWKTETEINQWIKDSKDSLSNEQIALQKFTNNKVTIRDVALEHNSVFDDKQYYDIYLRELQEAHFAVGASDLLRYQILTTEGGIYLDTDVFPALDIDKMINNSDEIKSSFIYSNDSLVVNELVKLIIFNQLDDKNLQILKDKIDKTGIKTPDIGVWKKLSFALEKLILENYIKEPKDVSKFFSCIIGKNNFGKRSNAFIISSKQSFLLKDVQNRIKDSYQLVWKNEDEVIKNLVQKLISNVYVLYKTGPGIFPEWERDWDTDFGLEGVCSFASLNAISTWINTNSEEFVSFEDLIAKYTLQLLLTVSKPNIQQLEKYQEDNKNKLSELKNQLKDILETLADSDNLFFKIIDDLEEKKQIIIQEIATLEQIQNLISEKISSQDFDDIASKINQNPENENHEIIAISINSKL